MNERLRSCLDSTQFRIRNLQFVQPPNRTFSFTFSTNEIYFLLNNVFTFNHWFSDFLATFLLSTVGFQIFQPLLCYVIAGFQIFQNFFTFNRWFFSNFVLTTVFRYFSNFFAFNCWFSDFFATF